MSNPSTQIDRRTLLKQALLRIEELERKLAVTAGSRKEPVAIVGIGCRFPGGVDGPESYWRLLQDGIDAITEVPPDRWDVDRYYDPDREVPGKTATRWGGFLKDVDRFDAGFFGISPREAVSMDPQHRLFLEVVWEALENAGQAPDALRGSQTGVFLGITTTEYLQLHTKFMELARIDAHMSSGNVTNAAAGRVSYVLGLHGPSMALDTACSSSLVAAHLACQSLRTGDCDVALVGGVNVILIPETYISFSKWGMMAADGRCKTFDAAADGFVRGEGCGVVVLKRLSDALANGDRILALLRGSAVNQDGASSGLTVPNGLAQQAVIRKALDNASVDPARISYVEAHGTGTALGDPIEVEALAAVLGQNRSRENPLLIGSVKTNLGHLESASGIAGLIKVILALQYEEIPPHLHLKRLSPHIPWEDMPILVPTRRTPWPRREQPRIAGLSGFGFSGTNAHIILEEAPSGPSPGEVERPDAERPLHLLALSAKGEEALREVTARYEQHLAAHAPDSLADICFTANSGRSHFSDRVAVLAGSTSDMREKLAETAAGKKPLGVFPGQVREKDSPKLVFLFTGQGSQYIGAGRKLYDTQPTFRRALQRCDELLRPYLDRPFLSVLYPEPGASSPLDDTLYAQPALFALEYALVELWRSWGIEPAAVMGHSVGEYVAACVAGVFPLEDGLKLIAARGRLMQELPATGTMAAVFCDHERVVRKIAPFGNAVSVAAINGPENTVISGTREAVGELQRIFAEEGIKTHALRVSSAFHSSLVEPIVDRFQRTARQVRFQAPAIRLVSNLTGDMLPEGEAPDDQYWCRHLREPVQFRQAMETLYEQKYRVFVEIGPNPVLLGMGRRCLPEDAGEWLPSLRKGRDDWQQMLESLGALYAEGVKVNWSGFDRDHGRHRVWLPTYPFERRRFWIDTAGKELQQSAGGPPLGAPSALAHPLLGRCTRSPVVKEMIFESKLGTDSFPFLKDHQVRSAVVVPATAYLEMVSAAAHVLHSAPSELEEIILREPLVLADNETSRIQLVLIPEGDGGTSVKVISLDSVHEAEGRGWKLHVTAKISGRGPVGLSSPEEKLYFEDVKMRCKEEVPVHEYYHELRERGLEFGPLFRGIQGLWRRDGESLGKVRLPEKLQSESGRYHFHPALLDACLQVFLAAWPRTHRADTARDTYLPLSFEKALIVGRPTNVLWSHALLQESIGASGETVVGDVFIHDEDDRLIAEIRGLLVKRATPEVLSRTRPRRFVDWLYEVTWKQKDLVLPEAALLASVSIPAPAQVAAQVDPRLTDLRSQGDLVSYGTLVPHLDSLSTAYVVKAFQELGWEFRGGQRFSAHTLAEALGVVDRHQRLLGRMLQILAEDDVLEQVDGEWYVRSVPQPEDPEPRWQTLLEKFPASDAELTLLGRCGPHLAEVLRGACDPLQLLFPGGSLELLEKVYQHSPLTTALNTLVEEAIAAVMAALPENSSLRILEVGAGTGGTTAYVLPKVPADRAKYVFTDISPVFLKQAEEKFRPYPCVRYQLLDIEKDPCQQGLASQGFDVVIAANVLHATSALRQSVEHVRKLLTPGGLMILIEGTRPQRWVDLTFGLTEGWWKFTDLNLRPSYPLLPRKTWLELLEELNFTDPFAIPAEKEETGAGRGLDDYAMILARKSSPERYPDGEGTVRPAVKEPGTWLILADAGGVGSKLEAAFRSHGHHCTLAFGGEEYKAAENGHFTINRERREDFDRLFRDTQGDDRSSCLGVIYLWSLDEGQPDAFAFDRQEAAPTMGCGSILNLIQALMNASGSAAPALWLVTRGAQKVGPQTATVQVAQAPVWGLGKVIALELPELHCVRVDLDPSGQPEEIEHLFNEVTAGDGEDQVAYRRSGRHVARLIRHVREGPVDQSQVRDPEIPALHLEIASSGVLDSLRYRPVPRRAPGTAEVEIRVAATGLNFKDLLNALGMYPGDAGPLGGECAGTIAAVGVGVENLRVGDEVMAIASGSFGTYVTARAELVLPKPPHLTFEEAATVPSAFMTAYYALHHLGKLSSGERVVIHAAAGGVGLAAVQLAQRAGAVIFATAGSPEKREFLKSIGVHHVMSSRSLGFADEIMELTEGQGVALVLNSLAGEFIPKSLAVVNDNGRFVEIGKRGIWAPEQVARFKKVGAYHVVDLAATSRENPGLIRSILMEVTKEFEAGSLRPLPMRIFPPDEVVSAFRHMQHAKHIGKIVVTSQTGPRVETTLPVGRSKSARRDSESLVGEATRFNPQATYLITGGLAGLGLLTARWMVERGARHLVLMGRSEPSPATREAIREMEKTGARILVARGDVSRRTDVARVLAQISESLPPLRGVIHSAGILEDGALLQLKWEQFSKVMAPKVNGGWILHTLTQGLALDFFVLYSSVASLLGSKGQGNHAAANAFLDALAHYRGFQGKCGTSINWGAWSEIGAAAKRNIAGRITTLGIDTFTPQEGLAALDYVMQEGVAQIGVLPVEWSIYLKQFRAGVFPPLLAEMADQAKVVSGQAPDQDGAFLGRLKDTPPSRRRKLLMNYVVAQALRVLQFDPSQSIDKTQPLRELGLDSLMAVELRNLIGAGLGLKRALPTTLLFDYPSVEAVTDYLANQVLSAHLPEKERVKADEHSRDAAALEELSEEEAEAMLLEELSLSADPGNLT